MSDIVFMASADPWGWGGFEGPDPVTAADSGWTWDVELGAGSSQSTYARSSLNSVSPSSDGPFWVVSGVIQYRTKDFFGAVTLHPVGLSDPDIIEALETSAWFNHTNRIFISLGVIPDEKYFGN